MHILLKRFQYDVCNRIRVLCHQRKLIVSVEIYHKLALKFDIIRQYFCTLYFLLLIKYFCKNAIILYLTDPET